MYATDIQSDYCTLNICLLNTAIIVRKLKCQFCGGANISMNLGIKILNLHQTNHRSTLKPSVYFKHFIV